MLFIAYLLLFVFIYIENKAINPQEQASAVSITIPSKNNNSSKLLDNKNAPVQNVNNEVPKNNATLSKKGPSKKEPVNTATQVDTKGSASHIKEKKTALENDKENLSATSQKEVAHPDPATLLQHNRITIVNNVTPEKTSYAHWSGTYQPDFSIKVDDKDIKMSSTESIDSTSRKKIPISYHAQFPANHSSTDTVTVELENTTQRITIDFDWHKNPRLQITQS